MAKSKYYNFEHEIRPPFRVVRVDQFEGHCEDGYGPEGYYDTLEKAVEVAQKITEEAIEHAGSVEEWHGMGDAGLVYDSQGHLVWDGVSEYAGDEEDVIDQERQKRDKEEWFKNYEKNFKESYSVTEQGFLIKHATPLTYLAFNPETDSWEEPHLRLGFIMDSMPLDEKEAKLIINYLRKHKSLELSRFLLTEKGAILKRDIGDRPLGYFVFGGIGWRSASDVSLEEILNAQPISEDEANRLVGEIKKGRA